MKKYFTLVLSLSLLIVLSACGSENEQTTSGEQQKPGKEENQTEASSENKAETTAIDFTKYPSTRSGYTVLKVAVKGFPFSLSAPKSTQKPYTSTYQTNEDGGDIMKKDNLIIKVDPENDLSIEIRKVKMDLNAAKDKVKSSSLDKFKSFLDEREDAFFYQSEKGFDKTDNFNFIRIIEKNGQKYLIEGSGDLLEPLSKSDAAMLYNIALTVK